MATSPPSITPAPTDVPIRGVKATFSARVDAFVTWLITAVTQFGALATNVYNNATDAYSSATSAETSATTASAAAAMAVAVVNATTWVSGTTYALGANVSSPTDGYTYRKVTASSVSTVDPTTDSTNWVNITVNSIGKISRSSNTILVQTNRGSFIEFTGTFTQTFTAAATLRAGWYVYLRNAGTGDITIPSSDGRTNWKMYPGETRLFLCDGTNFYSEVIHPYFKEFTASDTYIKPPGYLQHAGKVWSAGGSGMKATASAVATGGAGGGCFPFALLDAVMDNSCTVTIGAGGAALSSNGNGNAGGYSAFQYTGAGAEIRVLGGDGGSTTTGTSGAVVLNLLTGARAVDSGGAGFGAVSNSGVSASSAIWGGGAIRHDGTLNSGHSLYGGGAGASVDASNVAHSPGGSIFGGAGGNANATSSASAGAVKGGGGGGTQTGTLSGAGGRGHIEIGGIV